MEGAAVEARRGGIALLERLLAHRGQGDTFADIGGFPVAAQDLRQLAVEFDQALTLPDPLG